MDHTENVKNPAGAPSALNVGLGSTLDLITVVLMSAGPGAHFRQRKIFVCARCDCVYADAPVSECDCESGAREFIEGIAEYVVPNVELTGSALLRIPG